ncbi:MAG: ABC transporter permease, partial [Muribaculaceae bacterium]|nr:ABC transporter permease [Muribaculaceae bacterium]
QATTIANITPSVNSSGQWINGNNNYPSQAQGVNSQFLEIRQRKVAQGEMFTEEDVKTAAKVCVLGKTLVDNLFPDGTDPIGKIVRFGKIPMTIIGVLEEKGYNTMGQDQDDLALVPYTTVMKRVLATDYLQGIQASAIDENMTDQTIEEITEILRTQHKLREGEEDNFTIRSMQELAEMISSTSSMMTVLLAAVAGISLLVGGIGIMNIMIVSVTERTREIGLRMSIGATGRDIMMQFLIEAVIISVTGGLLGILLGAGATWMISFIAHWPVQIDVSSVILSFVVCTVIGIIFGFYPAAKASNLDPIEAIRYE